MRRFQWLLIPCLFALAACRTKHEDLSAKPPYNAAIGKRFILQQDFYAVHFLDGSGTILWSVSDIPSGYGISKQIDPKNIGCKKRDIEITGILKKGDVIKIVKIEGTQNLQSSTVEYCVTPEPHAFSTGQIIFTFGLLNRDKNPPETTKWSSPPIFKSEYALPDPGDGVWWK